MLVSSLPQEVLGAATDRVYCFNAGNTHTFRSWQSFYAFVDEILKSKIGQLKRFRPTNHLEEENADERWQELREQQQQLTGLTIVRDYRQDITPQLQICDRFGLQSKCLYGTLNLQLVWDIKKDVAQEVVESLEDFLLLWSAITAKQPGGGRIEIQIQNIGQGMNFIVPFIPSRFCDIAAIRFTSQKVDKIQKFLNSVAWPSSTNNETEETRTVYQVSFDDLAIMFRHESPVLAVSSIYNSIRLG